MRSGDQLAVEGISAVAVLDLDDPQVGIALDSAGDVGVGLGRGEDQETRKRGKESPSARAPAQRRVRGFDDGIFGRRRGRNYYRIHRRLTNGVKDFAAPGFFAFRLHARQYSRGGYPQLFFF